MFVKKNCMSYTKCVAVSTAPSCFHQSALLYGVLPPSQKTTDFPSIEGELMNCVMEYGVCGPAPPIPAHESQCCHAVIWSMSRFAIAVEGILAGGPSVTGGGGGVLGV